MTANELRVELQDTIYSIWNTNHPDNPVFFDSARKAPDKKDYMTMKIDFGDESQIDIGALKPRFRNVGVMVFTLHCHPDTKNSEYDAYIETIRQIYHSKPFTNVLLRGLRIGFRKVSESFDTTISTLTFQNDTVAS